MITRGFNLAELVCIPAKDPAVYKYSYLLRGLNVERVNQVRKMISYIPLCGFLYLGTIIDVHSRTDRFGKGISQEENIINHNEKFVPVKPGV